MISTASPFRFKPATLLAAALLTTAFSTASLALELDTYAEISDTRPGNITITPDGRVIITQQPLDAPELRVVQVLADGSKQPYPTLDWADGPDSGEVGIAATIGITTDSQGIVWILDMGSETSPAQFVAWDSKSDTLHKVIEIPAEVIRPISFLQDFALDEDRGQLYIADMTFTSPASAAQPAFIVVDIESGAARRVLQSDPALMPVEHDVVIKDSLMGFRDDSDKAVGWKMGLNPIAIDPDFEYVYFGTVNGDDVFRLPAAALADNTLDDAALSAQIETYAHKRPSDGFIVDDQGRIISGDVEASAIGMATPAGYEIIAQDDIRLAWPDGFAFAPDGTLYVTTNQLNNHPALNEGEDGSDKRYFILTIKP